MIDDFFRNYNYKKHTLLCVGLYSILFTLDMTVSYVILKKYFDNRDLKEYRRVELEEE